MSERFTVGIEEEFQLVDAQTGVLSSSAEEVLEKSTGKFEGRIAQETLQCILELISDILPDIATARKTLQKERADLIRFLEGEGLALISAGTHPNSLWREQRFSSGEHYDLLAEEFQDVLRADVIFGLHVHVGVQDSELAIQILNHVRPWLPHLLALSSNSSFWEGRMTGLKSYRSSQWKRFPRSGIPPMLKSRSEFENHVEQLIEMGAIDRGQRIWWDARPHATYATLEFRICDMPLTLNDTLALAALCQALVARIARGIERGEEFPVWRTTFIEENKWKAMRYGLDAHYMDFVERRRMPMRQSIRELLSFVDEVVDDLGTRQEMQYIRNLIESIGGTGADQQIAVYKATGDAREVVRFLREQTLKGTIYSG